ncbi:MAG TPA: glycosyltransferase family 1 protein [Tepidisphaeraceae bacterium]
MSSSLIQSDRPSAATAALRVGFETTGIYTTKAGIARYVRGLQRGIEELRDPTVNIFPLAWEVETFAYKQPQRAIKTAYRELLWGKIIAPRLLTARHADLLHSTSTLFLRCPKNVKHVITLHDLSITRHPERFRKWQVNSWNRRLPGIRKADRIICISQFTADEAMNYLGLPASQIDVVHNGCDWHPDAIRFQERKADFEVPGEFFLFVGSLEPGKNLKLLKETYAMALANGRPLPPLMIVGARWEGVGNEGEKPRDWHYLGYQPDEILLYLLRRALGLVFPSIYEGFGLPIVEAMAQSCPVICANTSSLPEIAGDAAMIVDLEPAKWLDAMRQLASNPTQREQLIARGRQRAGHFTWKRCAEQVVAVYHNVMGR